MQVRDVMTANPITIDPEAQVEMAVTTMRERGLRHLPVMDDTDHLLGIVTDRDLRGVILGPAVADYLPAGYSGRLRDQARRLDVLRVRHAMTWTVVTTAPDVPVAQAAAVMADARIGSLPVVDGKRLVGFITERDVLKALASTLPSLKGDPRRLLLVAGGATCDGAPPRGGLLVSASDLIALALERLRMTRPVIWTTVGRTRPLYRRRSKAPDEQRSRHGGIHGFGPVEIERDEPVFHHEWERRVWSLFMATGFLGKWNTSQFRFAIEQMPPAEYLRSSYYEHWLFGIEKLLHDTGLVYRGNFRRDLPTLRRL
jgi:CBS domain-containing protein